MRCPFCGAANRQGMTFCYACGESLDAGAPAAKEAPGRSGAGRRPSWEMLIGLAILIAVGGVIAVDAWHEAERAGQAAAYREGQTAQAAGRLPEALAAFSRAGAYHDAPALYAGLYPRVQALQAAYAAGVQAETTGAWWDATRAFRAASEIQMSYRDVFTRLQTAQVHSGPLFFERQGTDGVAALWWTAADGGLPRRLPESGTGSQMLALSPDDRWAVYSAPAGDNRAGPFLLDLERNTLTSLAQPFRDLQSTPQVRFRADSRGFWWSFANQAYYYDLTTTTALPLSELPGAVDAAHGRLLLNRLVLPAVNDLRSRLLLSDPLGHQRVVLADESGEVLAPTFSDDGNNLLYVLRSVPAPAGPGQEVTTTTLVLQDLDGPDGPVRHVLFSTQTVGNGDPPDIVRACFMPGTHGILALRRGATGWDLLEAAAGGPFQVIARALPGVGASAQQLVVVPGRDAVAAALPAAAGRTTLLLLDAAGQTVPVAEQSRAGRWLTFTPDGSGALLAFADPDPGASNHLVRGLRLPGAGMKVSPVEWGDWLPADLPVGAPAGAPAFSRDGGRVLLIGTLGATSGLYAIHPDGSDPVLVVPGATAFWAGAPPRALLAVPPSANFLER